ncbi:hypothetical protein ACFLYN_05605 [Chloroflexota bacterium]
MDKKPGIIPVSKLFQERLIAYNGLDEKGFKEWVFSPAMLFSSHSKWWGDSGKRDKPHEGLDLCFYRNNEGDILYLDETTKVPVIFKGRIEKIVNDFLGISAFVSHNDFMSDGNRLYTIYGHINPVDQVRQGKTLNEGDIIGTIADAWEKGGSIHSHLHISAAWIPDTIHTHELGWQIIGDTTGIVLLNPLSIIECPYSITDMSDLSK